jgi:broad specificity phosphatase PhoE
MEKHAGLRELAEAFQSASDVRIRQKAIDGLLREVSQRWIAGEVQSAEIPSWADFCERIRAAVGEAVNGAGSGASVAVFTSGGPTAATARMALGLDDQATLELTWSPRNASFSEFLFSGAGRFTLSTFNNTPHLTDARLHTYR